MPDIASRIGAGAKGIGTVIMFLVIPIVILLSFLRYSSTLAIAATVIGLPALILLALIPPTRGFAAAGFLICAYIFGTAAWVEALRAVWQLWGGFAAFVGVMFGGFGHVPMALFATAINKRWDLLGSIAMLGTLAFICQLTFAWVSVLADKRQRGLTDE